MSEITLKDIAKELNISASTVSRALADHPDISPATKTLVLDTVKKLNYNPNIFAQSLKTKKTKMIGVLVPEIRHDFFSSAISGIEEIAYQSAYTIIVCSSNESYEREVLNTNALVSNRVAGLIVSISQSTSETDHFQSLIDRNIPLVFFDRVIENIDASKVVIDDRKSASKAVSYLIERGYKKIAHLGGNQEINIAKHRLEGYQGAIKEAGICYDEELVICGGFHEADGYEAVTKFFNKNIIPDAIFAINDPVAIGAFKKLKEMKIKIPEDVAIIGFSNNPITELVEPKLTTVYQPAYEMGKKAAELIIRQIEAADEEISPQTIVMDTKLIIREST